jgi:hypothetical protein
MVKNLSDFLEVYHQKNEGDSFSDADLQPLKALSKNESAIYGFEAKIPAMVLKTLAMGVASIHSATLMPTFNGEDVGADNLNDLTFKSVGMKYTQYSLAYAMPLGKDFFFGISSHFMSGKVKIGQHRLSDPLFETGRESKGYVERLADESDRSFSKLSFTMGLTWKVGEILDVSLVSQNVGNPSIEVSDTGEAPLELAQRYRASMAFRPAIDWGFYVDADLKKSKLYPGFEVERQPISLGVEKGFFQNTTFLRLGLNTDISKKYIIGEKSNLLLSMGVGIRVSAFVVDAGLILNKNGSINGLAIAGYYVVN